MLLQARADAPAVHAGGQPLRQDLELGQETMAWSLSKGAVTVTVSRFLGVMASGS